MAMNFSGFKQASEAAAEWLRKEYLGIRSGQANPAILDSVKVNIYGGEMPLNQVSSILGESPTSIRINPWDKSAIKPIDSAIREANLGLSISADDQGVRVVFPTLTDERRQTLRKLAKEKLEEARVRIRSERQKVLSEIERSEAGDDDKTRSRTELQKLVDEANHKLEEMADKKEKEISQ